MPPRKRNIALTVIGVLALTVTVIALKRPLSERWSLWKLQSDDPATRDLAARSLGEMRSIRAIPPLIELLRQIPPEPAVKVYFVNWHGDRWAEIHETGGLAQIHKIHLKRPERKIEVGGWEVAYDALTRIGAPAVPALLELLGESDLTLRSRAINAFRLIGPEAKAAVPALIKDLEDPGVRDKNIIAYALSAIGSDARDAVPALVQLLDHKYQPLRYAVALSLWKIVPTKEFVPALVTALDDDDKNVRAFVAAALGEIGSDAEAAVPALTDLLEDREEQVVTQAKQALVEIQQE